MFSSSNQRASHHFMAQRISGIVLIPLVIWFCFSIANIPEASYSAAVTWVKSPINAIALLILVIVSFRHGFLGLQVIIEDYISNVSLRNRLISISKLVSYLFMAIGVLSIAKITLG